MIFHPKTFIYQCDYCVGMAAQTLRVPFPEGSWEAPTCGGRYPKVKTHIEKAMRLVAVVGAMVDAEDK